MYALAKFKRNREYPVIPLGWLHNENQSCWWPKRSANVEKMIENQELPEKTWNSFLKVVKIIGGNHRKAEKCLEVFLNHPTDQFSTDFDDSEIILPEDEQDDVATPNPSNVEKNNSTVSTPAHYRDRANERHSSTSAEDSESSNSQGSNSDSDSDNFKSDDETRPLKKRAIFMNTREVPRSVIDEVNEDQEDYYDLYDKEHYDDLLNEPKMFDKSPDPQKN
ncbi:hypothetical protein QAD02_013735 [Eretmocerus hayati]|uniref:Uncharacterized protein n=1 Tax=Eretmocerus hayati TaxID=131215 RepID=A0ACC2P3A7_9HYME|nr:hypothetical protein QAD02_013735 [Eretmocerus hayati]